VLPKISIDIHYFEAVELEDKSLELMLFLSHDSDDAPSVRVPIPEGNRNQMREEARNAGLPRISMISPIQLAPFPITACGDLRVRMRRGDDEIVRVGRLTIKRGASLQQNPLMSETAGTVDIPAPLTDSSNSDTPPPS
jgi:hypothetical protein